jgi:hypothetical protein
MTRRSRYRDAQLVKVTPAQAKKWRATGKAEQQLNRQNVDQLLTAMKTGDWDPDLHRDQPVKLSSDDQLQNGNHRTQAVAEYGKTVELWVWRNP